jgi:multiple sugar transport system permease protein
VNKNQSAVDTWTKRKTRHQKFLFILLRAVHLFWEWVKRKTRRQKFLPYLILLPSLLLLAGMIYPTIVGIYYSFTNYNLQFPNMMTVIGLDNYWDLWNDASFWYSFKLTVVFTVVIVGVQLVLSIGIALLLNLDVYGRLFFRSIILMPLMLPPVIAALMWKVMMSAGPSGVLNHLLSLLGVEGIGWIGSSTWAIPSIMMIDLWTTTPFFVLILLAGLQSLPMEPYESAIVDGATSWQVFTHITLPLLKPFIILGCTFRVIDALRIFDPIYATTMGGPGETTLNLHISAFFQYVRWNFVGYAMSVIVVLVVLVFVSSKLLINYWNRAIEQTQF